MHQVLQKAFLSTYAVRCTQIVLPQYYYRSYQEAANIINESSHITVSSILRTALKGYDFMVPYLGDFDVNVEVETNGGRWKCNKINSW